MKENVFAFVSFSDFASHSDLLLHPSSCKWHSFTLVHGNETLLWKTRNSTVCVHSARPLSVHLLTGTFAGSAFGYCDERCKKQWVWWFG